MTPEKTKQAFDDCAEIVRRTWQGIEPERIDAEIVPGLDDDRVPAHLLWMTEEAKSFVDAGRIEKAMRWLGFLQGALWARRVCTLETLKRTNMPDEGAEG